MRASGGQGHRSAVFDDPEVGHRGLAIPVPTLARDTVARVGPASALSRTPSAMRKTLAAAGADNAESLRELGLSDADIAHLAQPQVI